MREIKFRAWDKIHNRLYQYGSDEACILFEDGVDMMGMSFLSCQPNIVWMQYTGLKDKNGTKIYEGDIIKNTMGKLEKVVFNRGSFKTASINHPNANLYLLDSYSDYIEVVGNIYENPELLGAEQ